MSYTVETVNDFTKKIAFNFESFDLSSDIETQLKKKQKESNLKGFRKGHAPMSMIKQIYGPQVEGDAFNSFVNRELIAAIRQEELEVIKILPLQNVKYESQGPVSFEALVEIYPQLEVKDLSDLSFTTKKISVEDKDVDDYIKQNYLEQKAHVEEVESDDTPLANGHHSVINFTGEKEDGERPDSMKGEEFMLEIGSGRFIPGFEEGMIGMKKGDVRTILVTFPAEYQEESLQNAKVDFEVELLEIKQKAYPTLDDKFASEVGYTDLKDMKGKVREQVENQKDQLEQNKLRDNITNALLGKYEVAIADTLIDSEREEIKKGIRENLAKQNYTEPMMEEYFTKWAEELNNKARDQVKTRIIFQALIRKYDISVDESEVDNKIMEMTSGLDSSSEEGKKVRDMYFGNKQIKDSIRSSLIAEKVFSRLIDEVKVTTE